MTPAADGATSATGKTGKSSKKTKTPAQIAEEEAKKAKKSRKEVSEKVAAQHRAKAKEIAEAQKNAPKPKGTSLSAANKRKVRIAFNQLIDAMSKHNTDYICGHAYSAAYIVGMDKTGGCPKAMEKQLANVRSYKAKILGIGPVPDTNLAQVYTELTQNLTSGTQTIQTSVYFTNEGGIWKRAIAPPPEQ